MQDPLEMARLLASVYGHRLDRPLNYTQGVALSGRLRLHMVDPEGPDPAPSVQQIVEPYAANPPNAFGSSDGLANYAGVCWADELDDATGDTRYANLLLGAVGRMAGTGDENGFSPLLDPDTRVEDTFFAGTLLGRAYRVSGEDVYAEALSRYLLSCDTQQTNGLWWHCKSAPYFWGRGNGFAALGLAEALTYLPGGFAGRLELLERHVHHLEGLAVHQDISGLWRQVIDEPGTYLEHSASSMIGCAIARGLRLGWLPDHWMRIVMRAWEGVSNRIGPAGELEHVCVGTGPQRDIAAYRNRPYTDGIDDRGGSMALWFAVEMAALQTGRPLIL